MKNSHIRIIGLYLCIYTLFSCTKEIDDSITVSASRLNINSVLVKILEDNPDNTLNWDGGYNMNFWDGVVIENDKLIGLDIEHKGLTSLPSSINQLTDLKTLKLSGNLLSKVPLELFDLKNLEELSLSGEDAEILEEDFLNGLYTLTNLKKLSLSGIMITNMDGISVLEKLEKLTIENSLLGNISDEIAQFAVLTDLNLRNNKIESISAKIGELQNIKTLDISSNQFPKLPIEIGALTTLESLDIRQNLNLGQIPREICDLAVSGTTIFVEGECNDLRVNAEYRNAPSGVPAGFPLTIDIWVNAIIEPRFIGVDGPFDLDFGEIGFEIHEINIDNVFDMNDVPNQVLVIQSATKQFIDGTRDMSFDVVAPSTPTDDLPEGRTYRVRLFNTEVGTVKTYLATYELVVFKLLL
ncbi:leucine-rich repeat domain-containing protein [Aquimarina sp. MMG016]|uniref:leucine-rich repeat domain-containing protein n=1 Tax=Aquimarina sp. MMG016 TaxID=2822690 RepID=UPI001B39EACE|nr:leucine-rich repeat domain-containing protein [Aquimarina sp. MMG016]MBQ4820633.1 leucine-rich repeat domain-containing protein [Aquimarina sp. MMG016]